VVVILTQNLSKKLVFGVVYCFDDILVIAREVEEASTFSRRPKFGENVFTREGHEVISGVQSKYAPQMAENPRSIIFELEVVLGGWGQFVSGAVQVSDARIAWGDLHIEGKLMPGIKVGLFQVSVKLGVCSRDGKTNAGKHIIGGHIVDVVLVDFGAHNHPLIVVVIASSLTSSLLSDDLGPLLRILALWLLVEMDIRVSRPGNPAHQIYRATPA